MNPKIEIEKLNPRHHTIMDLFLKGWTRKQIASHLNMSPAGISILYNSPQFQHEFALRRDNITSQADTATATSEDEVLRTLRQGAVEAANKLVSGVSSENENTALKSAAEILDRTGHAKQPTTETNTQVVIINSIDANLLMESLELDD